MTLEERKLFAKWEYQSALDTAYEDGVELGKKQVENEFILQAAKMNYPIEKIAKIIGRTEAEIEAIIQA